MIRGLWLCLALACGGTPEAPKGSASGTSVEIQSEGAGSCAAAGHRCLQASDCCSKKCEKNASGRGKACL